MLNLSVARIIDAAKEAFENKSENNKLDNTCFAMNNQQKIFKK
jgi:hypothetical protein